MTLAPRPSLTGLPVLETDRLTLRGPQAGDWPAFRNYRASPRTDYAGGTKTAPEAAEQFASFFGHWVLRGFGRLIAEDRATRQPIGHFGPMQWEDGAEVELTWSLWTAEAEGKGLAYEAAAAARDWFFASSGYTTAVSYTDPMNHRSHRLCERLGATVDADAKHPYGDEPTLTWRHFAGGAA